MSVKEQIIEQLEGVEEKELEIILNFIRGYNDAVSLQSTKEQT